MKNIKISDNLFNVVKRLADRKDVSVNQILEGALTTVLQSLTDELINKEKPSELLKRYRPEILAILQRYESKGFDNLRVFGSVARGDDTEESDIDFIIDANPDAHPSLLDLIGMQQDLEALLGIKVDLITVKSLSESSKEEILGEAVAVDIWEPCLERLCEPEEDFDRALWSREDGSEIMIEIPEKTTQSFDQNDDYNKRFKDEIDKFSEKANAAQPELLKSILAAGVPLFYTDAQGRHVKEMPDGEIIVLSEVAE